MYTDKQKLILFTLVCIPVRIGILLLVYYFPRRETSALTWLIGLGFLYRSLAPTPKGIFKTKVYWSRPFHACTYILCSILLLIEETQKYAYTVLIADISLGFITVWNHYKNVYLGKNKTKRIK